MSTLNWSEDLVLNLPVLDHTHEEFVQLLNVFGDTLDRGEDALPAFKALLAHTEEHFAMEERWMAATGFEPENCHSSQHAMVLNVMREVVRYAEELGDREPMPIVRQELAQWFPGHAEMMDAALVYTMQQRGFDPASGECQEPALEALAGASGCGSTSCGH
ncbi:hemerythrin-like metal-binding domain protein [Roseateles sp. YR242]|uniref:hemerythrin domain-containing protein n=1 Tax=Roseateles sp. YR242 TaxID=1855305 RepID=UPI0008D00243|nr:hemerythrin domain-containing protein [Roseateles sp. YR242]SEK39656.1 hemerythrin-like metal-binding domain protein [Roseateles sp. YR242]